MPTPTSSSNASLIGPSGDPTTDALIFGTKWGSALARTGASLTYSIPGIGATWGYAGPSTSYFPLGSSSELAAVRYALQSWSAIANVSFAEVSETSSSVGDLRVGYSSYGMSIDTGAYAYLPSTQPAGGDVWLNSALRGTVFTDASYGVGGIGQFVFLHEFGHALGLKHPFEISSYANITLGASDDTIFNTVMSYNLQPGIRNAFTNSRTYATTAMADDIDAIQYIYGANIASHAGDDLYVFYGSHNCVPGQ